MKPARPVAADVAGDIPHSTAFVLPSGGNLGASQVGMLRALVEREIVPDLVIGSSVGAVNGAAFASDPTPAGVDRIDRIWRELDSREMVSGRILRNLIGAAGRGQGINDHEGLRSVIERAVAARRFDDLVVPFECVATDVERAAETWFDRGDVVDVVLASSSLPVLFPPVEVEGRHYLDGGILNDVPISRAVERGATTIYVLGTGRLTQQWSAPNRPVGMATQAYWIARKHRFMRALDAVPAGVEVHLLPDGDPPRRTRVNDLSQTAAVIESAHRASAEYLAPLALQGGRGEGPMTMRT